MGFSLSWLAIRGKDPAIVHDELLLRSTGEYNEVPETPICGVALASGWYVIVFNRCDFADSQPLGRLSRGAEIITCFVEEHVMASGAAGWNDGNIKWSLLHESDQGIQHLDINGEIPEIFFPTRDRLVAEQAKSDDVDCIFDIPVEVAKALTGFRHDEDIANAPNKPFERLERKKTSWMFWR